MVAEMGGLAEKEIADAVQALTRRDTDLALKLIAADAQIDALQRDIEERAILTIARRQPMAIDLREVVSALTGTDQRSIKTTNTIEQARPDTA